MDAGFGALPDARYPQSYPQVLGLRDFDEYARRMVAWSSLALAAAAYPRPRLPAWVRLPWRLQECCQ
jgi:hypothetical protein